MHPTMHSVFGFCNRQCLFWQRLERASASWNSAPMPTRGASQSACGQWALGLETRETSERCRRVRRALASLSLGRLLLGARPESRVAARSHGPATSARPPGTSQKTENAATERLRARGRRVDALAGGSRLALSVLVHVHGRLNVSWKHP